MHPNTHAATQPDKPAYIMAASGETVTYAELDARANQGARLYQSAGLKGDAGVAICLDNSPRYFEAVWAAERVGLYCTCLSNKLQVSEVEYILRDCGAQALVLSAGLAALGREIAGLLPGLKIWTVDGDVEGFERFETARDAQSDAPIDTPTPGSIMLYSSGTTGRPKGVKHALPVEPFGQTPSPLMTIGVALLGWNPEMVYLSPAPLYHAAPIRWCMAVMQIGGTVVVMEKFDAELALKYIEQYRVTHAQWVPTHFVRMLKLPEAVRTRYDMSSLQSVWHAAAPCPIPVKEQMIAWWGPIVGEYYAGTEGNGFCFINSTEWLAHKGSVGKGLTAEVKICDDEGNALPPRTEGQVYFAGGGVFEYHNDPEKTKSSYNQHGWSSLGDVGWLDEEGYLYLTDRKSFMIISGGVNIYPAEIENLLVTHPKVADVAVIGAPCEEMGEKVVAVIQPLNWTDAGEELAAELNAFARAGLSHVKAPRLIEFMEELPRHATGKLYKRLLRDAYWAKPAAVAANTPLP